MKKSQVKNRLTLVSLLTLFLVIVALVWIICALRVDFNGFAYYANITHYIDHADGGTVADHLHINRLEMQHSDFWALRLAAQFPFWGRLMMTAGFILLIYKMLEHIVILLQIVQEEQQRQFRYR